MSPQHGIRGRTRGPYTGDLVVPLPAIDHCRDEDPRERYGEQNRSGHRVASRRPVCARHIGAGPPRPLGRAEGAGPVTSAARASARSKIARPGSKKVVPTIAVPTTIRASAPSGVPKARYQRRSEMARLWPREEEDDEEQRDHHRADREDRRPPAAVVHLGGLDLRAACR